jgi:hypothetical protein
VTPLIHGMRVVSRSCVAISGGPGKFFAAAGAIYHLLIGVGK